MKTYCNIVMFAINIENLKYIYIYIYLKKASSLSFVCVKCGYEYKKYLKKNIQMKY